MAGSQRITCLLQTVKMFIKMHMCLASQKVAYSHICLPIQVCALACTVHSAELRVALACFQGQGVLSQAIHGRFDGIVRLLLADGANPNSRDKNVSVFMSCVRMMFGKPLQLEHRYLTVLSDVHRVFLAS